MSTWKMSEKMKTTLISGCFTIMAAIITGCCGIFVFNISLSDIANNWFHIPPVSNPTRDVSTIVPSANNKPQPTPTEVFLPDVQPVDFVFYDDFEFGLSDQWKVQYGELGMVGGKLTVNAPFTGTQTYHYMVLEDLYWGDVTVEVEVAPFDGIYTGCEANSVGGIILHQGLGQPSGGLLFCARYEGMQLGTFSDEGDWSLLSASFVSGWPNYFSFHDSSHVIKVIVKGNTYVAYFDNKKITSANIAGSEVGEIGLWFKTSAHDSVKAFAPRIESIRITSNEP